jgi:hypothetical protein
LGQVPPRRNRPLSVSSEKGDAHGDAIVTTATRTREPWNKGKLVGQKAPFKPKEIWAIRVRLQMEERTRELALSFAIFASGYGPDNFTPFATIFGDATSS